MEEPTKSGANPGKECTDGWMDGWMEWYENFVSFHNKHRENEEGTRARASVCGCDCG